MKRNVGKIQPSLRRLGPLGVEDIFIRVTPMQELGPEEPSEVSLVLLLNPERENNINAARAEAKNMANCIQQTGLLIIPTPPNVDLSTIVDYGKIRNWLRFHEVFRDSLSASN